TYGDGGVKPVTDTDTDGTPDYQDLDSDGDKVPDVEEGGHGPLDDNGDGVIDDPTDTDGDGLVDGVDGKPTTFGGLPYTTVDPDGDGLPNFQDPDSNNDGIIDGAGVSGGGCAVGGGTPTTPIALVVVVAGLLARRRRQVALVGAAAATVVTTLSSSQVAAEPAAFPVERFELSSDRTGLFDIESAEGRGEMTMDAGLWLGYANDPLVVYTDDAGRPRTGSLVQDRVGGSLVASLSPKWWLSLGFEMPMILSQSRNTGPSDISPMGLGALTSFGTGNLRLIPKFGLVREREHGIGIAFIPNLVLPTESNSGAYFGDHGVAFSPELAIAKHLTKVRLAFALGYRARQNEQLANLAIEDELFVRAGVGYQLTPTVEIGETNSWATAAAHPFGNFNSNHFESLVAGSVRVTPAAVVFGGMGLGWQNGFGTPDWRLLAGLRFGSADPSHDKRLPPPPLPVKDTDGDGLLDDVDRCPTVAEDKDGFEDTDGCADPDNDQDGVPDTDDECRDIAGKLELKGCPDTDGDGLPDAVDKCPTEAEDKDAFEDDDGCPELDNDKDGVVDAADNCQNVPGVVENHGCPDPDRDGDTVVDRLDNCPDEPGDPKNNGCKVKQLVTITGGTLVIMQSVYFQLDKAIILPKSFELLDQVAAVIASHPTLQIQVEGHTDNQGDDAYNKKLSQRRADAVVAYLKKRKIAADRLKAVGFGEEKPIADNTTKEGRAQNRRVVFTILSGGDNVKTNEQGADDTTKEK
ncbi:MAG: OmpA family protein, partial [Proteobacteria bacterium]|nr:OmpA family protein [Pseudomonadota bacterium]